MDIRHQQTYQIADMEEHAPYLATKCYAIVIQATKEIAVLTSMNVVPDIKLAAVCMAHAPIRLELTTVTVIPVGLEETVREISTSVTNTIIYVNMEEFAWIHQDHFHVSATPVLEGSSVM